MSQNTQKKPEEIQSNERREMPQIPLRPVTVSPAAIEKGTSFTIYFLAIEHFCNRYPNLQFTAEAVQALRANLLTLFETDSALHLEVRNFVSGMPLDAIAQSAHPKRIKQLLLESILAPATLGDLSLRTDSQEDRIFSLHDIARDLQYYIRLCELAGNPILARQALDLIMKRALLLDESALAQLNTAIESLSFKFLTDKAFCLNPKKGVIAPPTEEIEPPPIKKTRFPAVAVAHNDVALRSILLFRNFEKFSRPVVSDAGETYESIQRRVQAQQKNFDSFRKECQLLTSLVREDIYRHITSNWMRFSKSDPARLKRQSTFLDFLSNPA